MLASQPNGTLYIGSTDDLIRRVTEHRRGTYGGFTSRYGVHQLVWFEIYAARDAAFTRERQMKKWKRGWKLQLIEEENPHWIDLYDQIRLGDLKDASDWTSPSIA